MSFILDALRKSESERQREATPTLSRAPFATVRRETPLWIWIVIGALSVALMALAIGWWRTNRIAPAAETPLAAEASEASDASDAAGAGDAGVAGAPSAAAAPARIAAASSPSSPPPADDAAEPRSMAELRAMDPSLPAYSLQFIEYNAAEPGAGSAWINGTLYRPGERIGTGPELVEIRPDSVVVSYGGSRFLLKLR
jgi:general secretion pathway protein B